MHWLYFSNDVNWQMNDSQNAIKHHHSVIIVHYSAIFFKWPLEKNQHSIVPLYHLNELKYLSKLLFERFVEHHPNISPDGLGDISTTFSKKS